MARIILSGPAGEQWTNDTGVVQWQFHCSLINTCGQCLQYHMAVAPGWPIPLHSNCVLPGSKVVAPDLRSAFVARYDGDAFRITFTDGTAVSVTANHMLLTPHGFAPASCLMEGDEIINCRGSDREFFSIPDDDWNPVAVEEVVESLCMYSGVMTRRMPVSSEDLHGDGRFCQGDIDVISPDSFLLDYSDSSLAKSLGQVGLGRTSIGTPRFFGESDVLAALLALRNATDGGVGSLRERKASFFASLRHPEKQGIGSPTGGYSELLQNLPDHATAHSQPVCESLLALPRHVKRSNVGLRERQVLATSPVERGEAGLNSPLCEASLHDFRGDTKRLRDVLRRFSGKISLSRIRQVDSFRHIGPVYEIETTCSLYALDNGIVNSNCRCHAYPLAPGSKAEPWADFREILRDLPEGQKFKAIGQAAYRLLEAGTIQWSDVVTSARVRPLFEIVAREKLSIDTMVKAGVNRQVATEAFAMVNTPLHQAIEAHRMKLIGQLRNAGLTDEQIKQGFAEGLSRQIAGHAAKPPNVPLQHGVVVSGMPASAIAAGNAVMGRVTSGTENAPTIPDFCGDFGHFQTWLRHTFPESVVGQLTNYDWLILAAMIKAQQDLRDILKRLGADVDEAMKRTAK